MIKIAISGEGNSDVGEHNYDTEEFVPGPITCLTQTILHYNYKHDVAFKFWTRGELKKYPITLKGKKKHVGSGKGHSNLAYKLAFLAKETRCDVAILMRDADKLSFQSVYDEIVAGFLEAKFSNGVPAVPVPKSEAWLICCLSHINCDQIEQSKDDLKEMLEAMLEEEGLSNDKDTWRQIGETCDITQVLTPSLEKFKSDVESVTKYLN